MHLEEIAALLEGEIIGEPAVQITGLCAPYQATSQAITVAGNEELIQQAENSIAAALVISQRPQITLTKPAVLVKDHQQALLSLLALFAPKHQSRQQISPSATIASSANVPNSCDIGANVVIEEGVILADNVTIAANTVIGANSQIGSDCIIHPNVTIYPNSIIKDRVIIHAGCVIGADGFGYQFNGQVHQKRHHLGNVVIESDVEIGANTTIDRATLGSTQIGEGTKIDNLVQVAHNVELGKHNILCAYTGIAGSTKSGNNVIFAADVGVGDHVTIEDNVILGARTGIPSNKKLSANTTWLGNPGRPQDKAIEQIVSMQRIPSMKKQMQNLKKRIDALEKQES